MRTEIIQEETTRLLRIAVPETFTEAERQSNAVPVELLREAMVNGKFIQFVNCVVEGDLILVSAMCEGRISLENTTFVGKVDLSYTKFRHAFSCEGATFKEEAFFIRTDFASDVVMRKATFETIASFNGATGGGIFDFSGSTFQGFGGFNGTQVSAGSLFNDVQFIEEANFGHFRSGMSAEFIRAKFYKRANFNSAKISGHFLLRNANFMDECNISLAEISGNIELQDATFEGALVLGGSTVGGVAFFNRCEFKGRFDCISSKFKGDVNCENCQFSDEALFNGANIAGALFLKEATFGGRVSFQSVALNVVFFSESASETPSTQFYGAVDLRGCTYNHIHPISIWERLTEKLAPYHSQPFVQLEQTIRNSGNAQVADEVYYRRKQFERGLSRFRENPVDWCVKFLHWLLTGYGVRLLRLVPLLTATVIAGTLFFHTFDNSLKTEVSNNSAISESPTWNDAFLVTLNHFIPVVDIPVGAKWQPTGWYRLFALSLTLSGWILVPVSIAGLTGFLKR